MSRKEFIVRRAVTSAKRECPGFEVIAALPDTIARPALAFRGRWQPTHDRPHEPGSHAALTHRLSRTTIGTVLRKAGVS